MARILSFVGFIGLTCAIASAALAQNPAGVEQAVVDRYEARSITIDGGFTLNYRLLRPANIDPGRTYPLLLFLHGAGERGGDNIAQLKYLPSWISEPAMRAEYPCFVLAPQAPTDGRWGSLNPRAGRNGYADEPTDEMKAVVAMLRREFGELPVDRRRVYLTGLSMGGYGSWELATRHPELFAAVAPICGRGDTTRVQPLTALPIWAWHGDADRSVDVRHSREMVAAIRAAGGNYVEYTELPGVGHDSWTAAYTREDGLLPWLFRHQRGG